MCLDTVHGSVLEIGGVEYFATAQYGRIHPSLNLFMLMRFNAGPSKMTIDESAGGGATFVFPFSQTADTHFGTSRRAPIAVVSSDQGPLSAAWRITNAVPSGANLNLTVTTTSINGSANPLTLVTGDNVQVSNVGGCTSANGVWNSVTVSGTTITLPSVNCSGSYATACPSGCGVVTKNVNPALGPYYYEDIVFNMPTNNTASMTALRLEHARSICFNDAYIDNSPNPYYCQQHTSIAQDGSAVLFESNNGMPDTTSIYLTSTGFSKVR
jgi:hypothetical protein